MEEVEVGGAEVTTVIPWKVGWSTNDALAGMEELVLESCCSWASRSLCCWSVVAAVPGNLTPVSWVT